MTNTTALDSMPTVCQDLMQSLLVQAKQQLQSGERIKAVFVMGRLGEDADKAFLMPVDTSSHEAKQRSAAAARRYAAHLKANFCALVTESWSLTPSDVRKADSIYEKYGSLAAYPGRIDVLSLTLETAEAVWVGQAPIKPMPPSKKKRTLGALSWAKATAGLGSFANILSHDPQAHGPVH